MVVPHGRPHIFGLPYAQMVFILTVTFVTGGFYAPPLHPPFWDGDSVFTTNPQFVHDGFEVEGLYLLMGVTILFFFMSMGYRKGRCGTRACIVVLGDVGRSPRMQYHALSLANQNFDVEIVGYGGSKPHEELMMSDKIKLHLMHNPPNILNAFPRLFRYVVKVIWQSVQLLWVIVVQVQWPSHILVQNPPSIPTLAVTWLCSRLYGSKFMIDWHNYGYTMLALSLHKDHALVRFAKWFEGLFARWGDGHLCVSNAMKEDLMTNWGLKRPVTLYDRPPKVFKETPLENQHELFERLSEDYAVFRSSSDLQDATAFTKTSSSGEVLKREKRPALVITSTSWTEDEDISLLLQALEKYDTECQGSDLPEIVCVITGKGELKQHYQGVIEKMQLEHVKICTPWLTAEDYPRLLGACDLGVCLHTSSSGLDLPMKVVDMFGSGLPVCAVDYRCIAELVKHGENGMIFKDTNELSSQLKELLKGFPGDQKQLEAFRENIKLFQADRWEENWIKTVRPTLYI